MHNVGREWKVIESKIEEVKNFVGVYSQTIRVLRIPVSGLSGKSTGDKKTVIPSPKSLHPKGNKHSLDIMKRRRDDGTSFTFFQKRGYSINKLWLDLRGAADGDGDKHENKTL